MRLNELARGGGDRECLTSFSLIPKEVGVVALVLFDLRRRHLVGQCAATAIARLGSLNVAKLLADHPTRAGDLSMVGTNGDKHGQIKQHFALNIAGKCGKPSSVLRRFASRSSATLSNVVSDIGIWTCLTVAFPKLASRMRQLVSASPRGCATSAHADAFACMQTGRPLTR